MRCMPWPLAIFCWLDNRLGAHEAHVSWVCAAHGNALSFWYGLRGAWDWARGTYR